MPDVKFSSLPIPFRRSFTHAAAVRTVAENVVVRVADRDGCVGLGEGCPRVYVTGETVDGALTFLAEKCAAFSKIENLDMLRAWMEEHEAEIDANPSAFCAAELALLDL